MSITYVRCSISCSWRTSDMRAQCCADICCGKPSLCCCTLQCQLSAMRLGYTAGTMPAQSAIVSRVRDGRCWMLGAACRRELCECLRSPQSCRWA